MPNIEAGFKLMLDAFTDPTNGVNKCLVLTDVYDEAYNLVAALESDYTAASTQINLTVGDTNPSGNDVEEALEAQSPANYATFIAETWTDTTIIRVNDGVGYSYWKAYYLTKQSITFAAAIGSDYGGEVSANNLPLTFNILANQTVQAVALYHNNTKVSVETVKNETDTSDFQYRVDSVKYGVTPS